MATKQQYDVEVYNSIAGMSKSQLYQLMFQMKTLVDNNQSAAKRLLTDNPDLTKGLFQAQIILGMVKPVQPSKIKQVLLQPNPSQVVQLPKVQTTQLVAAQSDQRSQSQLVSSQQLIPPRQQQHPQSQPAIPRTNTPPPLMNIQSNAASQAKGPTNAQLEPSQTHMHPPPSLPQYTNFQPHNNMHNITSQPQQLGSLQIPGLFNQPLQAQPMQQQPMQQQPMQQQPMQHQPMQQQPMQQQQRPLMQPFSHQMHPQMPHNLGFQQGGVPQQQHFSQPMFHAGSNVGSFPQGQPPLPNQPPPLPRQPPPQQFYQGGPHVGQEYNQLRPNMQAERGGSHWIPGLSDRAAGGTHLPGPPPLGPPPGQMPQGLGAARPPPVISLTISDTARTAMIYFYFYYYTRACYISQSLIFIYPSLSNCRFIFMGSSLVFVKQNIGKLMLEYNVLIPGAVSLNIICFMSLYISKVLNQNEIDLLFNTKQNADE